MTQAQNGDASGRGREQEGQEREQGHGGMAMDPEKRKGYTLMLRGIINEARKRNCLQRRESVCVCVLAVRVCG